MPEFINNEMYSEYCNKLLLVITQITLLNFVHSKNFPVVPPIIEIRFLQGLQIRYFFEDEIILFHFTSLYA